MGWLEGQGVSGVLLPVRGYYTTDTWHSGRSESYKTTTVIQYVLALTDLLVISSEPGILKLIISKCVVKGFCMINMVHRVYTTYQCKVLGDDIH